MTRGNQRDKAREKNLKDQAQAVWVSQQSTSPLHMVRGWPGKAQDANPTLYWLHSLCRVCFVKGRADVIRSAEEEKYALWHRVSED
jgi:hypothetical protein